ncbi:MAG TPA: RDD family protein [Candidatus Bathyarchaeia archaeon]|nr:RDD family protein [Candidatus Bathyarchaeia archaeon]
MAYCTKCGAQLPENALFCPVCGNPTKIAVPSPPPVPSAERTLVLADWGSRFVAWLIDVIIMGIILTPLSWVGVKWVPFLPVWIPFVSYGLGNIIHFLYWSLTESYMGQSVGKIVMGIKVTNLQGGQPTLVEAAIESLGKAFLLPIDLIVGWIVYPAKRQRLFGYLSRTLVVRKQPA